MVFITVIIIIVLIAILIVNVSIGLNKASIQDITKNIESGLEKGLIEGQVVGEDFEVDLSEYETINLTVILTSLFLSSDCNVVSFEVTADQAYSIALAFDDQMAIRPLTHDILRDVLEEFDIEILAGMVSDYKDGIYYATIYAKRGNQVVEMDARPSDTIALLLRIDKPIYVKKSILTNSTNIC